MKTSKQLQDGYAKGELILHTGFLNWPVRSLELRAGWLCGLYVRLKLQSHRDHLKNGRLARTHHRKPLKGEEAATIPITESEVNDSFLWHENLGAALEAKKVLYETHQLDQQRYCEPRSLVSGERARAALLEFINLKMGDEREAINFIGKFGEFDFLDLDVDDPASSELPPKVQEFCRDCLAKKEDPFLFPLDQFWDTHKDLKALWRFAESLSSKNMDAIRKECTSRRPNSVFSGEPDWLAIGKAVLSTDLSASLNLNSEKPPRLLLHDREGQFIALLLCTSVRSALYVQLLNEIVSGRKHCQCLTCGGHFSPRIKTQEYCSSRCQNIAKVRRSRAKKGKKHRRNKRNEPLNRAMPMFEAPARR